MARIRSIHPGLFTDEGFVSLSMAARMLLIGIWTECDDQGVFPWKPITLKLRIMGADNVDIEALLAEMVEQGFVTQFEYDGKNYGAVRNFRKFQRPKKPTEQYPLPHELRTFVGLEAVQNDEYGTGSPPAPPEFPTGGEKSPQMEDGGGGYTLSNDKGVPPPDDIWSDGKALLTKRSALTAKEAGSRIGRWNKLFGADAAGHALAMAREADAADPAQYVERLLKPDIRIRPIEGKTHIMGEPVKNMDTGKLIIDEMREEAEREHFRKLASGRHRVSGKAGAVSQAVS